MDDVYLVTTFSLATRASFNEQDHVDLMEFLKEHGCVGSKHLHLLEVPLEVLEKAISIHPDLQTDLDTAREMELSAVLYALP